MSRLTFLFLITTLSITSCIKEEEDNNSQISSLQFHFDQFEEEASLRNIHVDLSDSQITGTFDDIDQSNVAGQCFFNSHSPNHIVIDRTFWENASHLLREMVVFHELGHCYLGRGHDETQNNQGVCLSIMRSGISGCLDNYNSDSRDEYLDELFGL